MDYNLIHNAEQCRQLIQETVHISLVQYSHIPTAVIALLMGTFVYFNAKNQSSRVFFLISIIFSLWLFFDITAWIGNYNTALTMFSWSLLPLFDIIFFTLCLYFIYLYINKVDVSYVIKILYILLILPVILLIPTVSNLSGFTFVDCEALENTFLTDYVFYVDIFITFLTIFFLAKGYFASIDEKRTQILILSFGIMVFLSSFYVTNALAAYTGNYDYELYGLFGMTFFIAILGYLIVKFKAFNIKLLGAQALVVSLWFLVGSLLFVAQSMTTRVVAGVTLIFTSIAGYYLVRSVKKEVKQREELEILTEQLAKANDHLKIFDKMKSEFVSIASHQLRSPLTSIRGYASMLAEGSYGKLPERAMGAAANIAESSMFMAKSIEDYLNVSRIEAGNMKYEMSDFNLIDIAEKVVDEMRPTAMKKGLVMVFRSDVTGSATINADIGKTRQIIMNLLDNSIKYTPSGTITVVAHDDVKAKKIFVTIQDTGVGMSKETQEEVFEKFVRAKNANQINVTGTGLGLYVAKKMITEMQGKVWAESEGEGRGSTFNVEFPLISGKGRYDVRI